MFRRLWLVIKSWLGAGQEELRAREDSRRFLPRACDELGALHARSRERAVAAITRRNVAEAVIEQTESRIRELERAASRAKERGRYKEAEQIRATIRDLTAALVADRQALAEARAAVDDVREAIRREESRILEKTAQALKEQMKNSRRLLVGRDMPPLDRDSSTVFSLLVAIVVMLTLLLVAR